MIDVLNHIEGYLVIQRIGQGVFADVYLAKHLLTNSLVAMKVIQKKHNSADISIEEEITLMRRSKHPLIVHLFEVREIHDYVIIIMEYASSGTLFEWSQKIPEVSELLAKKIFAQLVSVIDYLHGTLFYVHRDLKLENILIDANANIRLIDFGLSNRIIPGMGTMTLKCGSLAYVAPEMLQNGIYNSNIDIWALGCILYALVGKRLPFQGKNQNEVISKILESAPVFPDTFSIPLQDLLLRLLDKNPNARITIPEIKKHPWFSTSNYAQIGGLNLGECLSSHMLDPKVLKEMTAHKLDISELSQKLDSGIDSLETTVYRILNCKVLYNKMKDKGIIPTCSSKISMRSAVQLGRNQIVSPKAFIYSSSYRVRQKSYTPTFMIPSE